MGISLEKKFIYFVIPKTGSSTLRKALSPCIQISRPTPHFSEHVPIQRFLESDYKNLFEDYFKFSFVRNPYDRLYSGFQQDLHAAYNLKHWADAKRPIFDVIGDDFNRYIADYVVSADIRQDPFWICFCPMTEFTHLGGKQVVDFVGRTETLRHDINKIEKVLNLEAEQTEDLNVRNASRDPMKYIQHYDRRSIEIVNEIYRDDFEQFGYEALNPSGAIG